MNHFPAEGTDAPRGGDTRPGSRFAEVDLGLEPRSIVCDVRALLGYSYHPALSWSLRAAPALLPSPELCAAAGQDVGVAGVLPQPVCGDRP